MRTRFTGEVVPVTPGTSAEDKRISDRCILLCFLFIIIITSPLSATMIYGVGAGDSQGVYRINVDPGATSLLVATPGIEWYGATDGDDESSIFGVSLDGSLYRIDVVAKATTAVGSFGTVAIKELAYDELNDVLYGTDYSSLYSIDIVTASATLIGSLGGNAFWAMDYDASIGKLVGVSGENSTYSIETATGAVTIVGPTGQERITDLWYDPVSGKTLAVGYNPNGLYTMDSSGAALPIWAINERILGLGRPIPEPCTLILLAAALPGVMRRKRPA